MSLEEFRNLRIGHTSYIDGAQRTVANIDRNSRQVMCGWGRWTNYRKVDVTKPLKGREAIMKYFRRYKVVEGTYNELADIICVDSMMLRHEVTRRIGLGKLTVEKIDKYIYRFKLN